jgi:IS30 family transposase
MYISHETIYLHAWRDKRAAATCGVTCARRARSAASATAPTTVAEGSERPPEVASRTAVGHWEIDTVMGNDRARHSVVTIVERATGYLQIGKLERHCAADTTNRCIDLIERQQARFATITADNGTEFHSYKDVEAATGVEFYFATPHHAWERGTNENTNGLIRQYLPKGPSMADLTQAGCDAIAAKLNSRPRKRLSFRTPQECYAIR